MEVRGPARLGDVLRYLAVGGVSVAVDIGLLYVLAEAVGVPLALATSAAFGVSVLVNFMLNRLLHATSRTGLGRHALRYLTLLAANMILTVVVVVGAASMGVPYLLAKATFVVASTAWNFVLYRHWVFVD